VHVSTLITEIGLSIAPNKNPKIIMIQDKHHPKWTRTLAFHFLKPFLIKKIIIKYDDFSILPNKIIPPISINTAASKLIPNKAYTAKVI
jgi:hypothetical protein